MPVSVMYTGRLNLANFLMACRFTEAIVVSLPYLHYSSNAAALPSRVYKYIEDGYTGLTLHRVAI